MKTTKQDREQLREVAADYTGLGSLGIAPMLVVRLLDDLDTQESELTKLRKRVEVLERALKSARELIAAYDCQCEAEYMLKCDGCAELKAIKEALSESAKIAEGEG